MRHDARYPFDAEHRRGGNAPFSAGELIFSVTKRVRCAVAKLRDVVEQMLRGEIPPPPVASLIGMRLESMESGRAVMVLDATPRHANPMGTLHGGILCDVADAAMGMAYASELDDGETFATLELKINFLKPVWTGRLQAIAHVVKRGRTIGLVECDVLDPDEELVARASSTVMTLRGKQAEGR